MYIQKLNEKIPNPKHQKESVLKNTDSFLLIEIKENTTTFPEILNIRQRAKLLDLGYKNNIHPKCKICDNDHFTFDENKNLSEYCSKKCRYLDKDYTKGRVANVDQKTRVQNMKKTNVEKYGVEYQSQRTEVKEILKRSKILDQDKLQKLNDKDWLINEYLTKPSTVIADEIGVFYGTVIDYLRKYNVDIQKNYNKSYAETEIKEYIESICNYKIIQSHNIEGFEADLFIPEKKLAIEHNGTYWHSSIDYTKQYKHINKKILFNKNDVKLIQFTDLEWKNKTNIVKSMISSSIGKFDYKIRASDCEICEINNHETKLFCIENHINGYAQSTINICLKHKNDVVMIISFAKPRFKNETEYEIIRLCSKINHIVYGGASKILKYFLEKYNPNTIMTYADLSYGDGKVYEKLNFKFVETTKPGYFWVNSKGDTLSRYQTMKKNLHNLFCDYKGQPEREFMVSKGFKMYFNCGNNVYKWSI